MKNVAVIWSSPNADGLTASAKNQFILGLTDAGTQVREIHLNRKRIEHCRACGNGWGTCNKKGTCIIQDDFAEAYQALKESDGIVWISAVYWSDMTECFKELPHNTAAHLAVPFPTSAACRFLDLPPVNLRNLQLHLSKNSLAS